MKDLWGGETACKGVQAWVVHTNKVTALRGMEGDILFSGLCYKKYFYMSH